MNDWTVSANEPPPPPPPGRRNKINKPIPKDWQPFRFTGYNTDWWTIHGLTPPSDEWIKQLSEEF